MAAKGPKRDQHYAALKVPREIHILGTGSVGKFIAHSIKSIPQPPPVTLLFHRPSLLKDWDEADRSITLTRGTSRDIQTDFNVNLALPSRVDHGVVVSRPYFPSKFENYISDKPIHNLIVCVKAHQTVSALSAIKHRLTPDSTILFLQNGMGMAEEVSEKVYPDPLARPNCMLGIISHGVNSSGPFSVIHAGHGTISIGQMPREPFKSEEETGAWPPVRWSTRSRYLQRSMTRIPVLAAVALRPTDLLQAQLEKLAVNCIINPLTVLLDNRNGCINGNFALKRTIRLLLGEISLVIRSLPELRGIPNIESRFSPNRLEHMVSSVAAATAENISSMLQDTRRGSRTEIEYINGYIVKRGEELGIKPAMNYMLMQTVIGKQKMIMEEVDNYLPFNLGTS